MTRPPRDPPNPYAAPAAAIKLGSATFRGDPEAEALRAAYRDAERSARAVATLCQAVGASFALLAALAAGTMIRNLVVSVVPLIRLDEPVFLAVFAAAGAFCGALGHGFGRFRPWARRLAIAAGLLFWLILVALIRSGVRPLALVAPICLWLVLAIPIFPFLASGKSRVLFSPEYRAAVARTSPAPERRAYLTRAIFLACGLSGLTSAALLIARAFIA